MLVGSLLVDGDCARHILISTDNEVEVQCEQDLENGEIVEDK